jgi:hypothetical protein
MSTSVQTSSIELQSRQAQSADDVTLSAADQEADTTALTRSTTDQDIPDGGYGWVVVFASSFIMFWFVGTTYSWGVIQAALVREQLAPTSTLSFVGSLTVSCISIFAILNARISRAIGARYTAMLGITLLGVGEILTGFTTHTIGGLFATAGVVMGLGVGYNSALWNAALYVHG